MIGITHNVSNATLNPTILVPITSGTTRHTNCGFDMTAWVVWANTQNDACLFDWYYSRQESSLAESLIALTHIKIIDQRTIIQQYGAWYSGR